MKVKRLLALLLIAAIISIFMMPYMVHRKLPPSPLIQQHHKTVSIGASDANAQAAETGLLASWLLSNAGITALTLSAIEFLYQVLKDIIPFLSGRPAAAATYCVAKFFAFSQNRLVQNLGKAFGQILSWGDTLSSNWWNFAAVANLMCTDMMNKCGASVGNYVCHSYLNLALDPDFQPCVSSSAAAALLRQHFDVTFPQCQ